MTAPTCREANTNRAGGTVPHGRLVRGVPISLAAQPARATYQRLTGSVSTWNLIRPAEKPATNTNDSKSTVAGWPATQMPNL